MTAMTAPERVTDRATVARVALLAAALGVTAVVAAVLTFVVPGGRALGLVTSIPMAAGAIGLGYFAWQRASGRGVPVRARNS
jgi:hypothetical protein